MPIGVLLWVLSSYSTSQTLSIKGIIQKLYEFIWGDFFIQTYFKGCLL